MENDMIEKRLSGLVLEQYKDIRFDGNPTEVAYQFCRAVFAIASALENVGVRGIDYVRMSQPSSGSGGGLPDAEYASHVRRMADLERIAHKAFDGVDDHKLYVWSELRMPLTQARDEEGCSHWRTASVREVSDKLRTLYGVQASKSTVDRWAKSLDNRLDAAARCFDWRI